MKATAYAVNGTFGVDETSALNPLVTAADSV